MWRSLKHKFVLPFFGIYELQSSTASQLFLVSPYMRNGTLAQWRKTANPSVSEIEKRVWAFPPSAFESSLTLILMADAGSGRRD